MKQNRLSLKEVEWGEFFIKDIFTFTERGKRLKVNDREVGNIPFITAGESGNGISSFINNKNQKKYYNAITIDMFGNAYYQEDKFTCDDNITILKNQSFSKEIYLFLTSRLNILKYKYSYGKQLRPNRLNRDRIMLPIDSNSNPNWQFMEDYIKQEQKDIAQKVISYYEQKLLETSFDIVGLKDVEWKQFKLNEIFNIYTGKDIIISKVEKGIYPVITHSIENNGIGAFSQGIYNRKLFDYKNTISLADRGNFHAFVQSHDFYIGTRVKALELLESFNDTYLLKFLCMSINKQKIRFSYGFNATNNVDNITIILPVDKNGNPHWEYMSKFMRNLETEKLEKVLEYIYIYRLAISYESKLIPLDKKEWKEFWLEDIVDIKSGVRLTKAYQRYGNTPFIGAVDGNNGITNFIDNTNSSLDNNVLGVNYNGSVVESFYHPYKAVFSDDVKRIHWKNGEKENKYTYLFLKKAILKQKEKYTYGYKFNAARMNRQKILLPINYVGGIDFDYIEKYMQIKVIKEQYKILEYYYKQLDNYN